MKPQQLIQKQVAQVKRDLADEFEKMGSTAKAQVTGTEQTPALGQSSPQIPNPNEIADTAAYRQNLEAQNQARIQELRVFINRIKDQESQQIIAARQAQESAKNIAEAQSQAMQGPKPQEEKKGIFASLGRAAKRVKGRLGQVGKGKMEKGRGGGG